MHLFTGLSVRLETKELTPIAVTIYTCPPEVGNTETHTMQDVFTELRLKKSPDRTMLSKQRLIKSEVSNIAMLEFLAGKIYIYIYVYYLFLAKHKIVVNFIDCFLNKIGIEAV